MRLLGRSRLDEVKLDHALVRKLRLEKSWSQETLAEKAGLNLRTVQRLESNGAASLRTRRCVAAALGVDPSALDFQVEAEPEREAEGVRAPVVAAARPLTADLYTVSAVLLLGFVILDQIYARSIVGGIEAVSRAAAFSQVADFLLEFTALSALTAVAAIWAVWGNRKARLLYLGSVLIGVLLPILLIVLIDGLSPSVRNALEGSSSGALVRFSLQAFSTLLALWGWTALRTPSNPPRAGSIDAASR
jgi:transcriptional regulator with XRE-family HTH domain